MFESAMVIADPGRALRSALGWHVAALSGRLVQDNEAITEYRTTMNVAFVVEHHSHLIGSGAAAATKDN